MPSFRILYFKLDSFRCWQPLVCPYSHCGMSSFETCRHSSRQQRRSSQIIISISQRKSTQLLCSVLQKKPLQPFHFPDCFYLNYKNPTEKRLIIFCNAIDISPIILLKVDRKTWFKKRRRNMWTHEDCIAIALTRPA